MAQAKVGWRPYIVTTTPSSLWTSVYAVYNADAVGSSSLKTSLVAAYNAESNTNDSFGTNNGTPMGGLTYTTGKIGNAFNFNGTTSYVQLGDVMDVGTSSWSYSFWFKSPNAFTTQVLFSKSLAGSSIGRVWSTIENNRVSFNFQADSSSVITTQMAASNIANNTWYHVVLVLDRTDKLKMYINGALYPITVFTGTNNLTPYTSTNYNTNHPFRIGAYTSADNTTPSGFLNGQIDAFNVYNRVLTESEVTELYNSGNGAQYITDSFYKPTANDALNTYNGTAQGGLTYGVGKVGTAFQFNGSNSYVELGDVMDVGLSSWSYSFWVKANVDHMEATFFSKSFTGTGVGRIFANVKSYTLTFTFTTIGLGTITIQTPANSILKNNWYHIVCVLDRNDKLKAYINGILQTITVTAGTNNLIPFSTTNYSTNHPFRIGCYTTANNTSPATIFNGQIDAFNVWNRVLTQSEITELYNSDNGKQYPN
jgi:hypothetical protein